MSQTYRCNANLSRLSLQLDASPVVGRRLTPPSLLESTSQQLALFALFCCPPWIGLQRLRPTAPRHGPLPSIISGPSTVSKAVRASPITSYKGNWEREHSGTHHTVGCAPCQMVCGRVDKKLTLSPVRSIALDRKRRVPSSRSRRLSCTTKRTEYANDMPFNAIIQPWKC